MRSSGGYPRARDIARAWCTQTSCLRRCQQMHKNADCTLQLYCGDVDVWQDDSEAVHVDLHQFRNSSFSTCGHGAWRETLQMLCISASTVCGMSVSRTLIAFFASPFAVWQKVLLWFLVHLPHFSILYTSIVSMSQVHVPHSASARTRHPQYGNTHAAFAYFSKSTAQHTVAVVDSQQIIFFANRQNFSLKMFAGSVALRDHLHCKTTFDCTNWGGR